MTTTTDRRPRLTFACELDAARLTALFGDPGLIEDLRGLRARVVLMLSDYSGERASVVRRLNQAGVPVVGVPLVPTEQGYVRTDREVWMLYSSFMRRLGPRLLCTYGPESAAIAVGTTGGGPDVPGHPQMPVLSWQELARDLRLARRWTDDLYVHSLEGCVWQGFLPRLRTFDWTRSVVPPGGVWVAHASRRALRGVLRGSAMTGRVLRRVR